MANPSASEMKQYLFSYGTLQLEKVQLETFGRPLTGFRDSVRGYKLLSLEIKDESVLSKSEQQFHPIAKETGNENDVIEGTVFEVTAEELESADKYEVDDYKRVEVRLSSGKPAWIYIGV